MSIFFGSRAPELMPERAQHLNLKPAGHRKILHERSLSDLNMSSTGKPTIRLVDPASPDSSSSPDMFCKGSFPKTDRYGLKTNGRKQDFKIYSQSPTAPPRAPSRNGASGGGKPLQNRNANRMSNSTTTSNADTLVADSLLSPTSFRHSFDGTLRGTPTQFEGEEQYKNHLATLREQSSEKSLAVEQLQNSDESRYSQDGGLQRVQSENSITSYPSSPADRPPTPPRSSRRPNSPGSGLGLAVYPSIESIAGKVSAKPSKESMAGSQRTTSDRSAADSTSHFIKYATSTESIRVQYASVRPPTAMSHSASSAWSVEPDNVPDLSIPRKRGHMHSGSLGSHPSLNRLRGSYLSTIASESDEPTSTHFSSRMDSGASPQLGMQTWPRRRRTTISSSDYGGSEASQNFGGETSEPSSSSSGLAILRSEASMPEPLFSSSQPIMQRPFDNIHSVDTNELDDTIGELQSPVLRPQRSGYIQKQRSQTELRPSSRQSELRPLSRQSEISLADSARWSQASSFFPQWAKSFYRGQSGIASANASHHTLADRFGSFSGSKASMAPIPVSVRHGRSGTQGTNASITTPRPESSCSNWETVATDSPSSRFVPSIFRPRNRPRAQTDATNYTISQERSYPSIAELPADEIQPVARPLRHSKQSVRPLRQSKQSFRPLQSHPPADDSRPSTRQQSWRSQHGPHPLSIAAQSWTSLPRLIPNKRLSQHLSTWRVPSIDEPFHSEMFAPANRQIVAFVLGFLFPPLWIFAAFLHIPQRPRDDPSGEFDGDAGVREMIQDDSQEKVEANVARHTSWSWDQERQFLKARWWRTLNRIMSIVGILLIAAVIALAVIASRT